MKTLLLIILLTVAVWYGASYAGTLSARRHVYQVCNDSRQQLNGYTEQECADLQDSTHTEFMCAERNMLSTNHCWVEGK